MDVLPPSHQQVTGFMQGFLVVIRSKAMEALPMPPFPQPVGRSQASS